MSVEREQILAWLENVRDTETDGAAWKTMDDAIRGIRVGAPEALPDFLVQLAATSTQAMVEAVVSAGFRVSLDLQGKPALWCIECERDSGFHHATCTKSRT